MFSFSPIFSCYTTNIGFGTACCWLGTLLSYAVLLAVLSAISVFRQVGEHCHLAFNLCLTFLNDPLYCQCSVIACHLHFWDYYICSIVQGKLHYAAQVSIWPRSAGGQIQDQSTGDASRSCRDVNVLGSLNHEELTLCTWLLYMTGGSRPRLSSATAVMTAPGKHCLKKSPLDCPFNLL